MLLLLLLSGVLPAALGQTNPPANRYLVVIETAQSMQRRAAAISGAVGNLLSVGLREQFHPGDSVGLWTYEEELHTGRFPLQRWSPQDHRAITERVLTFLNEQTYTNHAKLDKVFPALERLIKASPYLTVIMVTDGEEPIHGTPFDTQINDVYKAWRDRQQKAQMPFVTLLRARQGTVTDFSVAPAPWQVEVPPLPPELQLTKSTAPQAEPAAKPPAPAGPVLVFHGTDPTPSGVEALASALKRTNAAAVSTGQGPQSLGSTSPSSEATATAQPGPDAGANSTAPADASNAPVLLAQAEPLHYQAPGAVRSAASNPAPTSLAASPVRRTAAPPKSAPAASVSARTSSDATRVQATAPVPPTGSAHRKKFWIAALVLVTALVGLGLLVVSRARPSTHVSLITRSLERQSR